MANIPEEVLEELEEVRAGGETNMYAYQTVLAIMLRDAGDGYSEAAAWLVENKDRYMEALNAMGARRIADG